MTTKTAKWGKRGSASRVAHAFVPHPDSGMRDYLISLCPAYWAARTDSVTRPGGLPRCRDCTHVLLATGISVGVVVDQ